MSEQATPSPARGLKGSRPRRRRACGGRRGLYPAGPVVRSVTARAGPHRHRRAASLLTLRQLFRQIRMSRRPATSSRTRTRVRKNASDRARHRGHRAARFPARAARASRTKPRCLAPVRHRSDLMSATRSSVRLFPSPRPLRPMSAADRGHRAPSAIVVVARVAITHSSAAMKRPTPGSPTSRLIGHQFGNGAVAC